MGAVYLGVHPLIGKKVAIKVLHAEFADKADVVHRFFQEARAVSQLRHPHIVELIDFGKIEGNYGSLHYCVMELLEGEVLRDRLKRGPIPEQEAAIICNQIADAVAAAHRQQIIHRDLKPENIFLVGPRRDTVKILDFGIAKLTGQGQASMQTQAGTLLGTPSYMSPEQCMARPVDARTDVYALGIILFEMCTGRVPFIGEGYADLLIKQINGELPSPRSINPSLSVGIENVIARALEKDPNNRFQSMEDFQRALAAPARVSGPIQQLRTAPPEDETVISGNVPTTLQGAASEMRAGAQTQMGDAAPRKRGVGAVLGVLAGLAIAGGVAAVILIKYPHVIGLGGSGGGTDPIEDPLGAVADPPKKKDPVADVKKMKLHVGSDPTGANVLRDDGSVLGTTPLDAELPADGTMLKLTVHKDGFKDEARAVILSDRDKTLSFHLNSLEEDKPKKKPTPHVDKPTKKTKPEPGQIHLGDDILAPKL
jgi:serine/threonine-protein kinase